MPVRTRRPSGVHCEKKIDTIIKTQIVNKIIAIDNAFSNKQIVIRKANLDLQLHRRFASTRNKMLIITSNGGKILIVK